jgi:HD-like signal output (HDOD) protein
MLTAPTFRSVLEQRLESEKIPVLRTTSLRLIELLGNMMSEVSAIADTILRDQGFTAQILKLANSAYFARGNKITTISKAVITIGYATLRDIALTVEYADLVQKRLPKRVQLRRILAKALVAARWASALGQEVRMPGTESLFTSALLESLGDLALAAYVSEMYQKIEGAAQAQGWSYRQAHLEVVGMTPHEVTTVVGWYYQLPDNLILERLCEEMKPAWQPVDRSAGIVHFANELAYNLFSWPYPEIGEEFNQLLVNCTDGLGIPAEVIQILIAVEYQKALKLGAALDLDPLCFAFQKTMPENSERNVFLGLCENAQSAEEL